MIPAINLLPARRVEARRSRRLMWRWAMALSAVCGAILPVVGVMRMNAGVDPALGEEARESLRAQDEAQRRLDALQAEREALDHRAEVSAIIAARPDWTRLIRAIGGLLGEDIVLQQLSIEPTTLEGDAGEETTRTTLMLAGLARDAVGAQALVVRLEGLGVFESVGLLESTRRSTPAGDLVVFRLAGKIRGDAR